MKMSTIADVIGELCENNGYKYHIVISDGEKSYIEFDANDDTIQKVAQAVKDLELKK